MRDITIYDWKNTNLVDWLLQIEKVAVLTNNQEYELAIAKSTSTPISTLVGKKLNGNKKCTLQ